MRQLVAVVLVAAFMVIAMAQESELASPSIEAGVYSSEQAERGQAAYISHCSVCHGLELTGGAGPALAGSRFLRTWGGSSLDRLYQYTKTNMPLDRAGTLPTETYLDILAHIFSVNGFPAGEVDLVAEEELLSAVVIPNRPPTP